MNIIPAFGSLSGSWGETKNLVMRLTEQGKDQQPDTRRGISVPGDFTVGCDWYLLLSTD